MLSMILVVAMCGTPDAAPPPPWYEPGDVIELVCDDPPDGLVLDFDPDPEGMVDEASVELAPVDVPDDVTGPGSADDPIVDPPQEQGRSDAEPVVLVTPPPDPVP